MDGAASSRPAKRETFKRNNQLSVGRLETLPPEVDPDCPDLSQPLLSPGTSRNLSLGRALPPKPRPTMFVSPFTDRTLLVRIMRSLEVTTGRGEVVGSCGAGGSCLLGRRSSTSPVTSFHPWISQLMAFHVFSQLGYFSRSN